jgi:hypothetical protein
VPCGRAMVLAPRLSSPRGPEFTALLLTRELVWAHLLILPQLSAIESILKKLELAMSSHNASDLQIAPEHCRAICDEIGYRLRVILGREASELPPRLRLLLTRLAELEFEPTPSIVPSMDDMVFWPTALAMPQSLSEPAR